MIKYWNRIKHRMQCPEQNMKHRKMIYIYILIFAIDWTKKYDPQGCDGSVLLNYTKWINDEGRFDTTIIVSEQTALPNLNSLRSSAFQIIEDMKEVLEDACPLTVSCADILALAARDAIFMVRSNYMHLCSTYLLLIL